MFTIWYLCQLGNFIQFISVLYIVSFCKNRTNMHIEGMCSCRAIFASCKTFGLAHRTTPGSGKNSVNPRQTLLIQHSHNKQDQSTQACCFQVRDTYGWIFIVRQTRIIATAKRKEVQCCIFQEEWMKYYFFLLKLKASQCAWVWKCTYVMN